VTRTSFLVVAAVIAVAGSVTRSQARPTADPPGFVGREAHQIVAICAIRPEAPHVPEARLLGPGCAGGYGPGNASLARAGVGAAGG
jgi:hypothetical protein